MQAGAQAQTILVVDDEPLVLKLCSQILTQAGYSVLAASDGKSAIKVCESGAPIDAALLDVIMPGMNGPELADSLAKWRPEIRIVFMSGYQDYQLEKYRPFSFKWFLRKPFKPDVLLSVIRDAMSQPGPREHRS
jgi:two-component system, cell cycle sensor histidine kinase and response regulator CckA